MPYIAPEVVQEVKRMVRACNVMELYSLLFQRGHLFVVFL